MQTGTSLRAAFRAFASSANPGFHLIGFDFYSKDCRQKRCLKTAGYGGQVNFVVLRKRTVEHLRDAGVPDERYCLIPGWFADTLNDSNRGLVGGPVSVVMIDCDAFSSAMTALRFIGPLLSTNSVMFFDDWRLNDLDLRDMGAKRAFKIFLRENPNILARRTLLI